MEPTDSDEEEDTQLAHEMFGLEIHSESESDTDTDLGESSDEQFMGDDMDSMNLLVMLYQFIVTETY